MKTITVSDEYGNKYRLEYTKNSIIRMEKAGFSLEKFNESPVTQTMLLVQGAFVANHSNTKPETIDKIYASLKNKEGFLKKLIEMYTEHSDKLVEEGNADWEANW